MQIKRENVEFLLKTAGRWHRAGIVSLALDVVDALDLDDAVCECCEERCPPWHHGETCGGCFGGRVWVEKLKPVVKG